MLPITGDGVESGRLQVQKLDSSELKDRDDSDG
jgi:hypothetical protein